MAILLTLIGTGVISLVLIISIILAGPHLLLPGSAMVVTVLVGALCIYVGYGMMSSRSKIMEEWAEKNPE